MNSAMELNLGKNFFNLVILCVEIVVYGARVEFLTVFTETQRRAWQLANQGLSHYMYGRLGLRWQ